MKTWMKMILGISLSFICLLTSVGYAAVTSEMIIRGDAEFSYPDSVFIVDISNVKTSNATIITAPVNLGEPSTKVMSEIIFAGRNAYVTFDVLIMNGTTFNQYFDVLEEYAELEGIDGSFSYANIDWSVTPPQGTLLKPGEQTTFTVTLTYTGRNSNQTRKMLHEFDFVLDSDDLTEAVSKGVTSKFEDILNNRLEEDIVYDYNGKEITIDNANTYNEVINHMENDSSGDYIGNLQGADGDDKALLTALFEGALTFTVGNEEVPITVMIKEKNVYDVDNIKNVNEMVLYITADDLGATYSFVPVYAAVFAKDTSGEWKQIGDIFAGEARTNNYSGWYGSGSFNTESWRSTQAYYGIAVRSGISNVIGGYYSQNP